MVSAAFNNGLVSPPASPDFKKQCLANPTTQQQPLSSGPKVKLVIPPELLPFVASASSSVPLYSNLSTETKARVAVLHAFANSPVQFQSRYHVRSVIGFGSNGVVLSALDLASGADASSCVAVAIKIIYKSIKGNSQSTPIEIASLRELNSMVESQSLLRCFAAWQDDYHFYLVTELFGSNWLVENPDPLKPLLFKTVSNNNIAKMHGLTFAAGASDLWAFMYACRSHLYKTEGHTSIPQKHVKHVILQVALALAAMHDAGYYHGDVKVENVLVQASTAVDGAPRIMLADYGHTKHAREGIKCYGTLEVAPCEFLRDSPYQGKHLDGRASDVFALGILLSVLLNDAGDVPLAVQGMRNGTVGFQTLLMQNGGSFPFNQPGLDAEVMDLLDGMCRVVPEERMTMDMVIEHPWFSR
ncbi:kinase-like domain-containing protein [Obelidium mucronatum]|nr:kinase-like domain-containing protein [Obelidium mucronatum]